MFSGGIGSWAAAKRVAAEHGTDRLVLLFSDVKGQTMDPHVGEDEDTYRFIRMESNPTLFDAFDIGGCGCFVEESP
jgi:hypothetical protein